MTQPIFSPSRLRTLREAKGLTQRDLAALSDVSQPAVAMYESGDRCPTLEIAARLARALGVRIEELLK